MSRRVARRPVGRPTALTPDTRNRLLDIVKKGNHLTTACAAVGIGTTTLYRWLEHADDADELEANGQPLTDAQQGYREFRDALRLARASAEMRAVSVIERSMEGGFVISERPLQNAEGEALYGPDGEVLYERTFTQPDGRLALNYLARSSPSAWGQNAPQRVELTGPGGGAVVAGAAGADVDVVARLALRIAEVKARQDEDARLDAEERLALEAGVTDAEIVEDLELP
jgi:hypothetical protein